MFKPDSVPASVPAAAGGKALLAGGIGNFIELFDYLIYGYFATVIAAHFFPESDPTAALLSTFAIFAVGFAVRPLGAIAFGHLGDHTGRRTALAAAVTVMGLATTAIGLLPTFGSVGAAAPVLLLVCRLVQGFAYGGEYTGANAFIVEYASPGRRGAYASSLPISVAIGSAGGVVVALLVNFSLTDDQVSAWGWRLPFLLAGPLGLFGLYLRRRIEDSPEFVAVREAGEIEPTPLWEAFRSCKLQMVRLFAWTAVNAVGFYLMATYMVSYLTSTVGLSSNAALGTNMVALVCYALGAWLSGRLADRFGRKPVASAASLLLAITVLPAFALVDQGGVLLASIGQGIPALFIGAVTCMTSVFIVELFPTRIRYTASAVSYNVCYVIFGGTAPYVATWLVDKTGSSLAPGWYLMGVAVLSTLAVVFLFRETRTTQIEPRLGGAQDGPRSGPRTDAEQTPEKAGEPREGRR